MKVYVIEQSFEEKDIAIALSKQEALRLAKQHMKNEEVDESDMWINEIETGVIQQEWQGKNIEEVKE